MLYKSLDFKNVVGQKVKISEIPVLGKNNRYYFMIQVRLQIFISSLYNKLQEKSCYSFRDYLKRKMRWSDFEDLFSIQEFRNNA
ncbi:DUF2535 family protein [Peribacillus loiseleuriae]|uniref:DUF2535 domain-containing protein n=1 Tax=Peribacillus loiseleuriae TaxID=1679170 RepID=A0A0K9GU76_9BACI|nr:DUF2535 family protein [Peribacillus loiseleuriae]KMY49802.1 hypothetical protein AC625_09865 [Peribacillus loiseleuriae]